MLRRNVCYTKAALTAEYLLWRETFNSEDLELGVFVADLSRLLVLR
jgi:hypothetical protein